MTHFAVDPGPRLSRMMGVRPIAQPFLLGIHLTQLGCTSWAPLSQAWLTPLPCPASLHLNFQNHQTLIVWFLWGKEPPPRA